MCASIGQGLGHNRDESSIMIVQPGYPIARGAATLVGISAIAAATRLNLEHAAASDPTSPIGSAITVFGLVTAACAVSAPRAWADGRKILSTVIVVAALAGEMFGLSAAVERMAGQRAETERLAASVNVPRLIAVEALGVARTELVEATRRSADATRGGCGRECSALRQIEAEARHRVFESEKALGTIGAPRPTGSPLAMLVGVDPVTIEIGLATLFGLALTLGGAGLVAFGAQPSGQRDDTRSAVPAYGLSNTVVQSSVEPTVVAPVTPPQIAVPGQLGHAGQPEIAGKIVEFAMASNGRLDRSVRGLATLIGKPKSSVHVALVTLVSAGVLSRAGDGAGYVLAA